MRTAFKLIAILFALTATTPALAAGDLKNFGEYSDGTVKVDLDTYTDGPKVVSLIGMKGNSLSISFAFDRAEWPKLLQLWTRAKAMTGSNYMTAGSLKEVGSSAQCVITFAGGPAVRMIIVDPTVGALPYILQPGDQSDFDTKLRQIGDAATIVN
jgi:hypothetical protein